MPQPTLPEGHSHCPPPSFTGPLLGIPCANLGSVVISSSTFFYVPLPPPGASIPPVGQGEWKPVVADYINDCNVDTMMTWLHPFYVPIPACFFFLV